jgi:hypothetical protein
VFLRHLALVYYATIAVHAVQIAHNNVFHEHAKHFDINYHFVRHHVLQGAVRLCPIAFVDQLADVFTKVHPPRHFHDLVPKLK